MSPDREPGGTMEPAPAARVPLATYRLQLNRHLTFEDAADVVPNHTGIAEGANQWWNDVLEHGPSSPYAERLDVDWQPVERHLAGNGEGIARG